MVIPYTAIMSLQMEKIHRYTGWRRELLICQLRQEQSIYISPFPNDKPLLTANEQTVPKSETLWQN